jgi:hypothetical protein
MKELIIDSKTHGRKIVLLDDEDYDRVIQWKWSVTYNPRSENFYSKRTIKVESGKWKNLYMHVFIMKSDTFKGENVDHRDHNGLNNTRENLRITDKIHNHMNQKIRKDNLSRYKGVTKHNNKFQARYTYNGKRVSIGYYLSSEEAARAYDKASKQYFGKFACLNFPEEQIGK